MSSRETIDILKRKEKQSKQWREKKMDDTFLIIQNKIIHISGPSPYNMCFKGKKWRITYMIHITLC